MVKTTIYLPDDLKRAVEAQAARTGLSEAEVIREAVRAGVLPERARPRGGLYHSEDPIADRADELLAEGFGAE